MKFDTIEIWKGKFGDEYINRNPKNLNELDLLYYKQLGKTKSEILNDFLFGYFPMNNILQVGCNRGFQLQILQKIGFKNLYGIDVNRKSVDLSKEIKGIDIIEGNAFDLPFKNDFFNLVFTDGLLIHINPDEIRFVLSEIYRVSKKYIMGFEYYNVEYKNIKYRGLENILWKGDFCKLYLKYFPDLKKIKETFFEYRNGTKNKDVLFMLKKEEKRK